MEDLLFILAIVGIVWLVVLTILIPVNISAVAKNTKKTNKLLEEQNEILKDLRRHGN